MVSKYTDKNKYGGFTWQIKIDNLFHIYILGTDNSSFIIEFKEWKWISYKTHFTFVSNKDLKSTIIDTFDKVFVFFQKHDNYIWSESQKNQKIEIVLKEFVNLSDIHLSDGEIINDKPAFDLATLFGFTIPIDENKDEIKDEIYSEEILDEKLTAFLNAGNLDGAINILEIYLDKNEPNLSLLIILARLKIFKKDRAEVGKIISKIMILSQSKIGFLTEEEIEEIDGLMTQFEKM